eukprot:51846_1
MSLFHLPFRRFIIYSSLFAIGAYSMDTKFNSKQLQNSIRSYMFISTNMFTSSSNIDGINKTHSKKLKHRIEDKSKRPKVGLGCLILRKNKQNELEFLVGVRKSSHGEGLYALPGGHLEYSESWCQCAYQEVLEETNLNIPPEKWKFAF